jgi:hypothetical protein
MNPGPDTGTLMFILSEIGSAGPVLFVYLIAGYFAIVYLERASLPSLLTLIGVATHLATLTANSYLFANGPDSSLDPTIFYFVSNCLSAVGQVFLVAALFVGRNHRPQADRYLRE